MTNSMINYLVFFIGVMMVLLSYFVLRRHQSPFLTSEDQTLKEREKKLAEYIDLAEEIIEELNTVSEQIIQSIDARTAEMSQMIEDIDNKIKKYKDEIHKNQYDAIGDKILNCDDDKALIQSETARDLKEETNPFINSEILRLYDEGYNPAQIARRLNKGIGEVQLIVNLHKK
ncbi:DUF6115 domain-containing protein [Anaerosolibacter sp.]|uniref:DUF6115 domain-containing protein n=1 Tax=Anaerosolibacter sp. TaxID=1872527 RepID=UPI0039EF8858